MERKNQTGLESMREDGHLYNTLKAPRSMGQPDNTLRGATLPHIRVTSTQKPHYGLINQGATCYLNSVLQVLFMTTEIHDRLEPKIHFTDQELVKIFGQLKKTTCETTTLTVSLRIDNVYQQRDAAECLENILHKVSPRASEVFQGQLTYTIKCPKDHIINEETNPFWTLPLSLRDAPDTTYSVVTGLQRVFQTKTFSGDNMVYCNECKRKTEATSGCEMTKFPQNLILLLKRFDFDYSTMSHFKSERCVEVPSVLKTQIKYKLYGMVNHTGSLSGGHYTATILSKKDKTWYEFDDTQVRKAGGQPSANKMYNSSTAYILVYRGKDKGGRSSGKKIKPSLKMMTSAKKKQIVQPSEMIKEAVPKVVAVKAEEQEGEKIGSKEQIDDDEQREDKEQQEDEEQQENRSERNTADEGTTQIGLAEDEGQMRKEREEEKPQAGGEEVAENRKPAMNHSDDLPDVETEM